MTAVEATASGPTAAPPPPPRRPRGPRPGRGYRIFQVANAAFLTGVVVVTLFPFVNIVARSFSQERYIVTGKVTLWPKGFTVQTYGHVMSDPMFWINYRNTVFYTVVATVVSMVLTTSYAYVLSKRQLRGRPVLIGIALFTMFFNGGLIPNYVLVSALGLRNSVWAIALPNAISVFNLLVMKSFFESLPGELEEASAVDGLGTYGTLLRVVLPLSKAMIATMILFYAVSFWNSWFAAFLYLDRLDLLPVTMYLRNIISGLTGTDVSMSSDTALQIQANVKAVAVVLTCLPITLVYPFIQRYFVSGVLLGAVKG
ncbi:carbohydrate ABC transporter permease [Plantactinospora siamensis]|uniref:Carbohydrate ABC transporter permease n=1 Tax=Plantactinospora siamensis TaxID=555372 RepID=A0ABV6NRW0_9ACTN